MCGTKAASAGAVSLNGANLSPVGTPLPQELNDTATTKVTCRRLDGTIADVAGWALVIANHGEAEPPDQIMVGMNNATAVIDGPVFLPDALETDTDSSSRVKVVGGDLWYTSTDCEPPPDSSSDPPVRASSYLAVYENIDVIPPSVRGGICTPRISGSVFSDPPSPSGLPVNPPYFDGTNGCRVFSQGRYTSFLAIGQNNYFKSGEYRMAFPGEGDHCGAASMGWPGTRPPCPIRLH